MNERSAENAKIESKYQHKIWTLNKLASYFGISKATLQENIDFSEGLLWSDLLRDNFNFSYEIHATHLNLKKINLAVLWEPKKFLKSTIYEEFVTTEQEYECGDLLMTMHASDPSAQSTYILAVYRDTGYDGLGGIVVDVGDGEFMVIEPIINFLKKRYPKEQSDFEGMV